MGFQWGSIGARKCAVLTAVPEATPVGTALSLQRVLLVKHGYVSVRAAREFKGLDYPQADQGSAPPD